MSKLSGDRVFDTGADLIFDDGIPEVVCKIAYGNHVPFILHMFGVSGRFG